MIRGVVNVVLVTVDCLRADHLGCYGYPRPTSTFLDRLAKRGSLFDQAISNGGATPEALPSLLASCYPPLLHPSDSPRAYRAFVAEQEPIAWVLGGRGYDTAAFHSNPYLSRFFGYHKGFDVFDDGMHSDGAQRGLAAKDWLMRVLRNRIGPLQLLYYWLEDIRKPYVPAEEITRRAICWLERGPETPFFLWVHYMDCHMPYVPPRHYRRRFHARVGDFAFATSRYRIARHPERTAAVDVATLGACYDGAIAYVDDAVANLVGWLDARGLSEHTLVVVTADHGQEFGEHEVFFHGHLLHDTLLHVPLLFIGPHVPWALRLGNPVALLDVAPTILDLLGIEAPEKWRGRSLAPLLTGQDLPSRPVISTVTSPGARRRAISCRSDGWKLVGLTSYGCEDVGPGAVELYNLRDDPLEVENVSGSHEWVEQNLKTCLLRALADIRLCQEQAVADYEQHRLKESIARARILPTRPAGSKDRES